MSKDYVIKKKIILEGYEKDFNINKKNSSYILFYKTKLALEVAKNIAVSHCVYGNYEYVAYDINIYQNIPYFDCVLTMIFFNSSKYIKTYTEKNYNILSKRKYKKIE